MNAKLEINGKTVQMDDEALKELNAVLRKVNIMQQKWENDISRYDEIKGSHLQIVPEFHLVNSILKD